MDGSLYERTLANGGGTFDMHGENFNRADITEGYAVAAFDGTYCIVDKNDKRSFNNAIHRLIVHFPVAQAIGTWVDGDDIHIDPVLVADTEELARAMALANNQLAYYIIHEQREVRL